MTDDAGTPHRSSPPRRGSRLGATPLDVPPPAVRREWEREWIVAPALPLSEDSTQLLRSAGARVETRLTASLEELDDALATAERRVVLLEGDGSVHGAANSPPLSSASAVPESAR